MTVDLLILLILHIFPAKFRYPEKADLQNLFTSQL